MAEDIGDLAKKTSIAKTVLHRTINTYNRYCRTGEDADFGRPKETMISINKPPYYSVRIMPTLYTTQGGPRRDKKARVLDAFGVPIPRLYSAGELGSITGCLYQGGSDLAEAIVFGQIAAKGAVAERSLS